MIILIILIIIALIFILYGLIFTPYPFVFLLRAKKSTNTDKAPNNIEEIKTLIDTELNVKYSSNYPNSQYDVYKPKIKTDKTIVWLHGGAFVAGSSVGLRNFGPLIASQGYNFYAINYAHAPEYPFPSQMLQLDEFLSFIKKEFSVEDVVLGGDSAGANIVACYSTIKNFNNEIKNKFKNEVMVKGLLLFCGPYDFCEDQNFVIPKKFEKFMKYILWSYLGHKNWQKSNKQVLASPLRNLNSKFPPSYICDGKKFSFMWQGELMVKKLRKEGVYVKSRFYKELPHEFQFDYQQYPTEALQVYKDSIKFLSKLYNEGEK